MAPSRDVSAERWRASRSFHHSAFPAERLAVERDATVTVCAAGADARHPVLAALLAHGVVDEVLPAAGAASGDVVAFVDAGAAGFGAHVVCGIVGPAVCEPGAALVVGASAGGRLSEITAKPLLRRHRPGLAALSNPLARELAVRRAHLDGLSDPGEGGEPARLAVVLAVHAALGLRGIAEVDLGLPDPDDAPLDDLAPVAEALLDTILAAA